MYKDNKKIKPRMISTKGLTFDNERRTGKSTRIVDNIIQLLFQGYEVVVIDHIHKNFHLYKDEVLKEQSKLILNKVLKRLEFEHPNITLEQIIKEGCTFVISIKDF